MKGLADIAASVVSCRSINTSDLAAVLPRDVKTDEERYRYINRWLANKKILPLRVMEGFVPSMVEALGRGGQTVIFMLDQSKISEGFECLMVSARVGERAIAVGWKVIETKGEIGFTVQETLLRSIARMLPEGAKIMLAADRFYGTAALIGLCQKLKWQYRIRLKGNLILQHQGGEIKTGETLSLGLDGLEDAQLNGSKVKTSIGILQEDGHPEPWIIAMDCKPNKGRTLDYGMRWGIEALFSDMKSRGFGVTETRLKDPDRIERLLLVLAIATYWAVSTGMQLKPPRKASKKRTECNVVL